MRIRSSYFVVGAVFAAGSMLASPASAQVGKSSTVQIKVRRSKKELLVGPRGVGACKRATADCENFVIWEAGQGNTGPNEREYVLIEMVAGFQKDGEKNVAKTSPFHGVDRCFAEQSWALYRDNLTKTLDVESDCPAPAVWLYEVTLCEKKDPDAPMNSENCEIIMGPVDPGILVDRGEI